MWIKTTKGALVNADLAETIEYDSDHNVTQAWIGDRNCVLADGNQIPTIATAIMNNKTFVGVQ